MGGADRRIVGGVPIFGVLVIDGRGGAVIQRDIDLLAGSYKRLTRLLIMDRPVDVKQISPNHAIRN